MEPLVLSIETATLAGSICVSRGREVLATMSGNPQVSHSNTLLADIDAILANADLDLNEVEYFAVATGPGSFTGLRIGIATVKALAETLNKPCVGIPTLSAIAHSAGESDRTLALLPAGRGEVFAQSFSVSADGTVIELDRAVHLPPLRGVERYKELSKLLLTGDGARVHIEKITEWARAHRREVDHSASANSGWHFVINENNLAAHVAVLAFARIEADDLDQPNALQAIYVRPSDAELNQPAAG
jgi:tRNA threonylcarbamoyladenosine biosynthesis protein TsaB